MIRKFAATSVVAAALAALLLVMPGMPSTGTAEAQAGTIIGGNPPPPGGGFGTFIYGGGSYAAMVAASGCPEASAAYFYNKPDGTFAVYIPGTDVGIVNEEIMTLFPGDNLPLGTIFIGRCV
jgi:hypothetical protein